MHCNKFCADRQKRQRQQQQQQQRQQQQQQQQQVQHLQQTAASRQLACLMKKHSSRPSKTRLGRVRLRLRVRVRVRLQGRVKVKANVYWCLRTHNKLRQSADAACKVIKASAKCCQLQNSNMAKTTFGCKLQCLQCLQTCVSAWWQFPTTFRLYDRLWTQTGEAVPLLYSRSISPSLSLHLSCTLWAFHFVSLKGVSEILPHLTLNDSCSALGQTAIHSLNDGIRRDSRERAQRTQPWQSAEGGESVRGWGGGQAKL